MADNNSIRAPVIQPIKLKEYETKQSKYPVVPQIPCRSVTLGLLVLERRSCFRT